MSQRLDTHPLDERGRHDQAVLARAGARDGPAALDAADRPAALVDVACPIVGVRRDPAKQVARDPTHTPGRARRWRPVSRERRWRRQRRSRAGRHHRPAGARETRAAQNPVVDRLVRTGGHDGRGLGFLERACVADRRPKRTAPRHGQTRRRPDDAQGAQLDEHELHDCVIVPPRISRGSVFRRSFVHHGP